MNIEPITPIVKESLSQEEKQKYESLGAAMLKKNKVAMCTLAGGQGTRLGHKGPKGTFIVPFTKIEPMSIFEIDAKKVQKVFENYGVWPFWYIMTSKSNDEETKEFFRQNAFFGIPEENILFFVQGELPLVREDGSKVADANGNEVYAANGNGGIFKALEDEGILFHMQENHVEYICSCNVDNILVNPFDEIAIGVLKENNAELGIKSVAKANAEEKVGNIVLKDGKTTVVEYIDMPIELAKEQDEAGNLKFSESHFGCNYISLRLLKRIADESLPIHEAHKKSEEYGEYIKQEMFIFDGFEMAESACVIRVRREDEFAPIKNKEGVDSPETAIKLYEKS